METKKETIVGLEGVTQAERSGLLRASSASGKPPESEPGKRKEQSANGEQRDKDEARPAKTRALRVLLWMLRKSVVPLLCIVAVLGGMYIGYSIIGKRPAADVFHWATWKHMYDLVFADS
ncbi:DNA-directed RNA polymerase subunit beta [Paenibacillus sp. sptzw28]|uniref:DNA-directed RNA polymerase subunit beta n=1 Tax=Paenibacillus sp. sptzw28 TaxID=715179 RepID=UPI001C6E9C7B|nr:DNA-directed RNA polymerase subunit beta [Paenibacillus sp. sptzw28]QYR22086.1 DNA-directed RNA polymerase subunit beta [Paenibacillus sp. sptzw28]